MKNYVYFTFFALVMLMKSTAGDDTRLVDVNPQIVGGVAVVITDYPHQASLRYNGGHICGASLISTTWLLTAAHCLGKATCTYTVNMGSTDNSVDGKVYQVNKQIIHASYTSAKVNNDIALIRISAPADTSYPGIAIIPLAAATDVVPDGTMTVVSGWGNMNPNSPVYPTILQAVAVPVVNQQTCLNSYSPIYGADSIDNNVICAGYVAGGKDSCQGDSGGPLTATVSNVKTLVGVVAFGKGCALANYPGVYTKVAAYRSWITTNSGV